VASDIGAAPDPRKKFPRGKQHPALLKYYDNFDVTTEEATISRYGHQSSHSRSSLRTAFFIAIEAPFATTWYRRGFRHARMPNGAPPARSLIMLCLHGLSLLHGILNYNLFDARFVSIAAISCWFLL
jgi:hypothetical protein